MKSLIRDYLLMEAEDISLPPEQPAAADVTGPPTPPALPPPVAAPSPTTGGAPNAPSMPNMASGNQTTQKEVLKTTEIVAIFELLKGAVGDLGNVFKKESESLTVEEAQGRLGVFFDFLADQTEALAALVGGSKAAEAPEMPPAPEAPVGGATPELAPEAPGAPTEEAPEMPPTPDMASGGGYMEQEYNPYGQSGAEPTHTEPGEAI